VAFDYFPEGYINVDGREEGHVAIAATLLKNLSKGSKENYEEVGMVSLLAIYSQIQF